MTAVVHPWRDALVGETVGADYVIALPKPGDEVSWQADGPGRRRADVAAIAVLPDGGPSSSAPTTRWASRAATSASATRAGPGRESVDVLPPAHCRAIDLKIDRDTGEMHVLLERKSGDGLVWWAGRAPAWGVGPKNIGIGVVGDTALALASRPGLVAVCGAKPVATRSTSSTRSPCCSARTSRRRSGCSTTAS
jgi:hypothetical protein